MRTNESLRMNDRRGRQDHDIGSTSTGPHILHYAQQDQFTEQEVDAPWVGAIAQWKDVCLAHSQFGIDPHHPKQPKPTRNDF